MDESDDVTRMRLVGGNLALDFVNTRSGPPAGVVDDDLLTGYAGLVSWASYAGGVPKQAAVELRRLAHHDPRTADAVFARARRIRDDLDEIFRTLANGREVDDAALGRLREDESEALDAARLQAGPVFTWTWSNDRSLARPLWPVVQAAIHLLLTGPLDRVKQCSGCRYLFLDESRNRTRRWCSMADCGTEEKIRRYVATRRAARGT